MLNDQQKTLLLSFIKTIAKNGLDHPQRTTSSNIDEMSIFDFIEMFTEWSTANDVEKKNFQLPREVKKIFNNTAKIMDI
jgi:hypothetical protein